VQNKLDWVKYKIIHNGNLLKDESVIEKLNKLVDLKFKKFESKQNFLKIRLQRIQSKLQSTSNEYKKKVLNKKLHRVTRRLKRIEFK